MVHGHHHAEAEPEPPPPPPEPPAPTFSEEELEAARAEAFEAGRQSVLNEGSAKAAQALNEALEVIGRGLDHLQPLIDRATNEISEVAAQVALEVCRKMLPHTADHFAVAEIEAMVAALMPHLVDHPRLIIRVNPRLAEETRERLSAVCQTHGFEGRIQIMEQANLAPSDTQLDWGDGGAERNTRRLWDAVDTLVARTLPRFARGESNTAEVLLFDDADDEDFALPSAHSDDLAPIPMT